MPFSYLHSPLCVLCCVKRVGDVQSRHRWLSAFYSFTDLIDSETRCRYSKFYAVRKIIGVKQVLDALARNRVH